MGEIWYVIIEQGSLHPIPQKHDLSIVFNWMLNRVQRWTYVPKVVKRFILVPFFFQCQLRLSQNYVSLNILLVGSQVRVGCERNLKSWSHTRCGGWKRASRIYFLKVRVRAPDTTAAFSHRGESASYLVMQQQPGRQALQIPTGSSTSICTSSGASTLLCGKGDQVLLQENLG